MCVHGKKGQKYVGKLSSPSQFPGMIKVYECVQVYEHLTVE